MFMGVVRRSEIVTGMLGGGHSRFLLAEPRVYA
jgi:hypothetical protein